MAGARESSVLAGPGIMLLSAAIFGYFGFASSFNHQGTAGQLLVFVVMLEWTLKVSAIVFLAAAVLTLANRRLGNFIHGVAGVAGAALFLVVAVLDYLDTQHQAIHPLLLLVFAAWNGYGSFAGLRAVFATGDEGPLPGRAPP